MSKTTRKLNVELNYIWKNILGLASGKKIKRVYFDRPVRLISNVSKLKMYRNGKGKKFDVLPNGFDLTEVIKRIPKLFSGELG